MRGGLSQIDGAGHFPGADRGGKEGDVHFLAPCGPVVRLPTLGGVPRGMRYAVCRPVDGKR